MDNTIIVNEVARPDRKFVETFTFGDGAEEWEVLTDTGWSDVKSSGKTVQYRRWTVETASGIVFGCAGEHILFVRSAFDKISEVYARDLRVGDMLVGEGCDHAVVGVSDEGVDEYMYDLELADANRRFYTSGLLSHNSIWMAGIAANAVRMGHNVAIVSLEMSEHKYMRRLGSNMLGIRMDEYKVRSRDTEYIKGRLREFSSGFHDFVIPGRLYVKDYPTSTASTNEIEPYLQRLEDRRKMKFKVVVIDYLNIMRNWRNPNTENTYMKIKQIAEDVRAMAHRNDWAVVSATQTKQQVFDENDMTMAAVAESSGLVATVDLMFAILQDPTMYQQSKYKLKVLANRDEGYKNAAKLFDINYPYMRLTETADPIMLDSFSPPPSR